MFYTENKADETRPSILEREREMGEGDVAMM